MQSHDILLIPITSTDHVLYPYLIPSMIYSVPLYLFELPLVSDVPSSFHFFLKLNELSLSFFRLATLILLDNSCILLPPHSHNKTVTVIPHPAHKIPLHVILSTYIDGCLRSPRGKTHKTT